MRTTAQAWKVRGTVHDHVHCPGRWSEDATNLFECPVVESHHLFVHVSNGDAGFLKEHFGPDLPVDPHFIAIGVAAQVAILVVAFLFLLGT